VLGKVNIPELSDIADPINPCPVVSTLSIFDEITALAVIFAVSLY